MKYQALFSQRDKSKQIKVSSAAILLSSVRVKYSLIEQDERNVKVIIAGLVHELCLQV